MLADTLYLQDIKYQRVTIAEPPRFVGNRCLHAAEGGFDENPPSMPNVRRALNQAPVIFTPALQDLAYRLMVAMNPTVSRNEFENVYSSGTAFTNRHGIETNDPRLMDGIICAGMFTTAAREGDYIVCYPGVHAIDADAPITDVQQVLDNGWYFVGNTGAGQFGAFNLPQGDGGPVYIPFVLAEPARYRAEWFVRWDGDSRPDPLRYYL